MRNRSEAWKSLARHGRFVLDTKARINGRDYTKISAPKINRALMSSPLSVGNCNSASLSFSVMTEDIIPPGSKVVILGRLLSEDLTKATEWAEFGTFFIDKREKSFEGLLALDCYDAMQKLNQSFLDPKDTGTWSRPMKSVVEEVACRIGVEIDPRTRIRTESDYIVTYPEDKTMQEVMGHIAACHGGNWIITEENLLRLVPLVTAPDDTFRVIDEDYHSITTGDGHTLVYKDQETFHAVLPAPAGEQPDSAIHRTFFIIDDDGRRIVTPEGYYLVWDTEEEAIKLYDDESLLNIPVVCGSLDTGDFLTVSGVQISNDDDGDFSAGDDSGFVLDIGSNPYATQTICNDLYAAYHGLVYQPFTAAKALFDPALELGDQLVIGDKVTGVLMSESLRFEHNFRADLEAPNDEQLNREYPYLTSYDRLDKVENQEKKNGEALEKVTVRVKQTEDSLESEVSRAKGAESSIRQTAESITLSVSNHGTWSTITLERDGVEVESQNINITGFVTFSSLSGSGTTTINGDNIITGTLDADKIKLQGEGGGFCSAEGYDGSRTTKGAMMYGSDPDYYMIVTDGGVRMQAASTSFYCGKGIIKASTAITEDSDRNLKHSINHDLESYKVFFSALKPAVYKFKAGTSDRFHTGFIAQEVEEALAQAKLTSQDFAGLVIDTHEDPEKQGEQVKKYGLRYTEFVALNTYMLQQAIGEINALKSKASAMEKRIEALERGNSNGR